MSTPYFYDALNRLKECSNCHVIRSFDAFGPATRNHGGIRSRCRNCIASHQREKRSQARGTPARSYKPRPVCDIENKTKECSTCRIVKSFEYFSKHKRGRGGLLSECKECNNKRQRKLYKPVKDPARKFEWMLSHKYGLSVQQYQDMLSAQNGLCWICQCDMAKPFIDHCHATGRVRGLLCHLCNIGLGVFKDRPESLERAMAYLRHSDPLFAKCERDPGRPPL